MAQKRTHKDRDAFELLEQEVKRRADRIVRDVGDLSRLQYFYAMNCRLRGWPVNRYDACIGYELNKCSWPNILGDVEQELEADAEEKRKANKKKKKAKRAMSETTDT